MLLGFLVGVVVGFIVNENWLKILTWLENTIQTLVERKKKNSKSK